MSRSRRRRAVCLLGVFLADRGLTHEDLCEATGFANSYVTRVKAGQIVPTAINAQRFAAALELSVEDLWPLPERLWPSRARHRVRYQTDKRRAA